MQDLNMSTIRAFVIMAELRSAKATGKVLETSHSNIHARIRRLECTLGEQLLERAFPPDPAVQGRTQLTDAGRDFLPRARIALNAYDALFDAPSPLDTDMANRLLAERLLEHALKALHHNLSPGERVRLQDMFA